MDQEKLIILILGIMLLVCGIRDLFTRRISLIITTIAGILIILLSVVHMVNPIWSILGGVFIGAALIFISKITDGQIGIGDGIIFCVTGLGLGFWSNLCLLLYSLTGAALFSGILFLVKVRNKKYTIPFIPFVCVGYIGVIML